MRYLNKDLFEDDDKRRWRRPCREEDDPRLLYFLTRLARPEYHSALNSSKPQCILKVASHAKGARMLELMKYITREDRGEAQEIDTGSLPFETADGCLLQGKDAIQEMYEEWRQDFERKRAGAKREPRHVTHMILSAKTTNAPKDAMKVNFAARDFLQKNLGELGYEYAFVTHSDTEHPHVHVVIKNYNRELKGKLHISKAATFDMREQWAVALEGRGLQAVATMRRDQRDILENVAKGIADMKARDTWSESKMRFASPDLTFRQRKKLAQRIVWMKEKLKGVTLLGSKERRQCMRALRDLDKAIREEGKQTVKATAQATLRSLGRDMQGLRRELLLLVELPEKVVMGAPEQAQQQQRMRRTKLQVKTIEKDIEGAEKHLNSAKLSASEKKQLKACLKQHRSTLKGLAKVSENPGPKRAQLELRRQREREEERSRQRGHCAGSDAKVSKSSESRVNQLKLKRKREREERSR